ncbi:MAG: hypothetical protein N2235_05355 [Fischerella sp.]|nr:hypothetical protein [Fischerella sp.]
MRPDLDKKLVEKYPAIFRDRYGNPKNTAMCWGFEHGDGWYHILDILCAMLYKDYNNAKREYERLRRREGTKDYTGTIVDSIRVERARLKMKEEYEKIPVAVQVKEKYGTLRFYVDRSDHAADDLIHFAELMSEVTCEECGNPGRLREGSWIRTLCDQHALEQGYIIDEDNHDVTNT